MALELVKQPGGNVWVAEAPDWTNSGCDHLKIGITSDAIRAIGRRGLRHAIGQLYGIVGPGLILTRHVFQGLKRDMYVRNDSHADVKKLALTWGAVRDAVFAGDALNGGIEFSTAPAGRVFAVYVSPNEMVEQFPSIHGWAEHWTWIAADPAETGAPIEWQTRYDKRLWKAD